MLTDVLTGVAIAALTGIGAVLVRWAVVSQRLPKRISRLEAGVVMLLRAQFAQFDSLLAVIRSQQGHKLNGELEEMQEAVRASKAEMTQYLSDAAISQKAKP